MERDADSVVEGAGQLKVLQVSPQDVGGGAERVALGLHLGYRRRGIDSRLLVRFRRKAFPGVEEAYIYKATSPFGKGLAVLDRWIGGRKHFRGRDTIRVSLANLAMPRRLYDRRRGSDDLNYPYSHHLAEKSSWQPNLIHLHNLHGGYFDLRALPALSRAVPVIWTLHDAWAITGHCAYFIDCDRWLRGCGACPDLLRAPALRKDGTHENWVLKRRVYNQSSLHVVCPSNWLMTQVRSACIPTASGHVIAYGVDQSIFKPGDRLAARKELGLPEHAFICLGVAVSGLSPNPYKDFQTVIRAIDRLVADRSSIPVMFVCLGGTASKNVDSQGSIASVGRITSPHKVARYYQAADVCVHAAHEDNFPVVILEAQSCGLPVVATAVGGIAEQIEDGMTGYLVARNDSSAMAARIGLIMGDSSSRRVMGNRAAERAARLFSLEREVTDYLNLYADLVAHHRAMNKQ
jgi:glycosyltransferase involved in cell wall biosynthesis